MDNKTTPQVLSVIDKIKSLSIGEAYEATAISTTSVAEAVEYITSNHDRRYNIQHRVNTVTITRIK